MKYLFLGMAFLLTTQFAFTQDVIPQTPIALNNMRRIEIDFISHDVDWGDPDLTIIETKVIDFAPAVQSWAVDSFYYYLVSNGRDRWYGTASPVSYQNFRLDLIQDRKTGEITISLHEFIGQNTSMYFAILERKKHIDFGSERGFGFDQRYNYFAQQNIQPWAIRIYYY